MKIDVQKECHEQTAIPICYHAVTQCDFAPRPCGVHVGSWLLPPSSPRERKSEGSTRSIAGEPCYISQAPAGTERWFQEPGLSAFGYPRCETDDPAAAKRSVSNVGRATRQIRYRWHSTIRPKRTSHMKNETAETPKGS
jgi:hypothetical protein